MCFYLCKGISRVACSWYCSYGDIASENILIDPHTLSAKLIDFDMASIEGTSMQAGGNPDFINYEMKTAIKNNKKIKS